MEIEREHESKEWSSISIVEEKSVEQFLEPNSDCCIYKLPQFIFQLNKAAYTPNLISIGPLHYGNKELMRMESQKERYRTSLERRVGKQALEEFKTFIQNEEESIRAHYSVTSNLPTSEYVELILRDVIFIMELFLRKNERTNDFLLNSPIKSSIIADLQLLENQLPYSLLNCLYLKAFPCTCSGENPSFFALCINFFKLRDPFSPRQPRFTHFTNLLRRALVMKVEPTGKTGIIGDLPCATKLRKSGLKFKTATEHKSLLDIQFAKTKKYCKWLQWFEANELQIPTLEIYDETEILLRNSMAWEMFHYPKKTYICNYANLMDQLIDTKWDVDFLVEKKIIVNHVGDTEVIAKMFNKICSNIPLTKSCYFEIAEKMKAHHRNPWNQAKTTLKKLYFIDLWTGTATVAATFLLALTVIQTFCSLMQLKQNS